MHLFADVLARSLRSLTAEPAKICTVTVKLFPALVRSHARSREHERRSLTSIRSRVQRLSADRTAVRWFMIAEWQALHRWPSIVLPDSLRVGVIIEPTLFFYPVDSRFHVVEL